MTLTKNVAFLLLISLLSFSACQKDTNGNSDDDMIIDDDITIIDDDEGSPPPPALFVNASVTGTVVDQNGQALENVNISVNTENIQTDENGVFILKNIQLNKYGALISAEKDGYYYNAKMIRPEKDKMAFTKMMMIEKATTDAKAPVRTIPRFSPTTSAVAIARYGRVRAARPFEFPKAFSHTNRPCSVWP